MTRPRFNRCDNDAEFSGQATATYRRTGSMMRSTALPLTFSSGK